MARPTQKNSFKKTKKELLKGVIHVQTSFNNTIVTVTNMRGQVISWSSAGTSGFKGSKKNTAFAAQTSAENAIRLLADQGTKHAQVCISGPGLGRDTAVRAVRSKGIVVGFVRDVTPMPHNGCRPPKKRRV